jgi:hypothetical protein
MKAVFGAAAAAFGLLVPTAAAAYGGPGSVITGIGAFLAALAAVAAAVLGFLWFPLKKLIRKLRGDPAGSEAESGRAREEAAP